MDKATIKRLCGLLTTVFGMVAVVLFMVTGIVYYQLSQMKATFQTTDAVIVSLADNHNHTVVSYNWNGKEYQADLDFYTSSYYEGKEIPVYVNPRHPKQVEVEAGYWVGIGVTGGIGLIFLLIAAGVLLSVRMGRNRQEKLLASGTKVEAEIEDVVFNISMSMGGRHPYLILCSWRNPENGVNYHFRSANLWENPKPVIEKLRLKTLPVYFDRKRMKRYFISLDAITESCGENVYL